MRALAVLTCHRRRRQSGQGRYYCGKGEAVARRFRLPVATKATSTATIGLVRSEIGDAALTTRNCISVSAIADATRPINGADGATATGRRVISRHVANAFSRKRRGGSFVPKDGLNVGICFRVAKGGQTIATLAISRVTISGALGAADTAGSVGVFQAISRTMAVFPLTADAISTNGKHGRAYCRVDEARGRKILGLAISMAIGGAAFRVPRRRITTRARRSRGGVGI